MIHGNGVVRRRTVRRAVRATCQVVSDDQEFGLIGERLLDVSPAGAMLACDAPVALGERVIVSFLTPDRDPIWLDAEAEVARVIHGFRRGDPGYCAGLRFTYLERGTRDELVVRLAGLPPPIPLRHPELRGGAKPNVQLSPIRYLRMPLPAGVARAAAFG